MNDAFETMSPIREPGGLRTVAEFLQSQREEFGDLNEFLEVLPIILLMKMVCCVSN